MYSINGNFVKAEDFHIPIDDNLVWRGDGIFDAIRVYDGFPFGLDFHLERLSESAGKLNLGIEVVQIRSWILEVAKEIQEGYVRTIVSRDRKGTGCDVYIFEQPLVKYPEEFTLQVQKAPLHPAGDFDVGDFSAIGVKSTSYALNMQHTRTAQNSGFTDALLISRKDIILEGPTFSVCWIKGDTIFTPSLNLGILDSVTRKYLYAICDDLNSNEEDYNIKIKEVEETIEEIFSSDAVFLLSTAKHAIQVAKVNETLFDLGQNTILNTIQRGYAAIIENEKTKFFDK